MKNKLNNRRVLYLTGATGGIGSSIAYFFAENDWDLCLFGKNINKMEQLAVDIKKNNNVSIGIYVQDLINPDNATEVLGKVLGETGRADALIHAAGLTGNVTEKIDLENWRRVFSVNVESPFFLSRSFANYLANNKKQGSIVTVSSSAAFYAGKPDYSASKLALISTTRSLAKSYARAGIRVNAIAPGYVETESGHWGEEKRNKKLANVPMGRLATPKEIASVAYFLCSVESSYITGAVLDVNGGLLYR